MKMTTKEALEVALECVNNQYRSDNTDTNEKALKLASARQKLTELLFTLFND